MPGPATAVLSPVAALQHMAELMLAGWNKLGRVQTAGQLFDDVYLDRYDDMNERLKPRPGAACALGFVAIADKTADWRHLARQEETMYYPTWSPPALGSDPHSEDYDYDYAKAQEHQLTCPALGEELEGSNRTCITSAPVLELIPHLNDNHQWDIPAISNWLFKLAASDEFRADTEQAN